MNINIARSKTFIVFLPNIFLDKLKPSSNDVYTFNEERDIDTVFRTSSVELNESSNLFDDLEFDLDPTDTKPDLYELDISDTQQDQPDQLDLDDLEIIQIVSAEQMGQLTSYPKPSIRALDTVPKLFYTPARLPNSTNLLCWGCGINITGHPWLMPTSIDRTDTEPGEQEPDNSKEFHIELSDYRKQQQLLVAKRARQIKIMKTIGVFHHVWCMGRFLQFTDMSINKWQCTELIKDMFKQIEGKELLRVPVGECPTKLARYCGPTGLSDEEYYHINLKNLANYVK